MMNNGYDQTAIATGMLAKRVAKKLGLYDEAVRLILLEAFTAIREELDAKPKCTMLIQNLGTIVKKTWRNKVLYNFATKQVFRRDTEYIRLYTHPANDDGMAKSNGHAQSPVVEESAVAA